MSATTDLIEAASHKGSKLSAGRKAKITEHIKKSVPKEQKKAADKAIAHVLDKDDASTKKDDDLVADIKAAMKGMFFVTSAARLIEASRA